MGKILNFEHIDQIIVLYQIKSFKALIAKGCILACRENHFFLQAFLVRKLNLACISWFAASKQSHFACKLTNFASKSPNPASKLTNFASKAFFQGSNLAKPS